MIISDLNYLELVNNPSFLEGGGDVFQFVAVGQSASSNVGGTNRNSIGNTALGLNLAIISLSGIGVL
jgi:hypothetical protein